MFQLDNGIAKDRIVIESYG